MFFNTKSSLEDTVYFHKNTIADSIVIIEQTLVL